MGTKDKTMKWLVELFRIVVGFTFLFSGLMKAIDPLGFSYKIEDYLIELGHTVFFPLALPFAVSLVTFEFSLGVFLLLGIFKKWTVRLVALCMFFFTPLTLWIALTNPVEDCGCFGDALVISNWQTFYKNIILLVGAILLLCKWRLIAPLFTGKRALVAGLLTVLVGVLFSLHNVYRLPVVDFRPYKIGANIPEQMFVDPDKSDVLETIFVYSKEGQEQEFTEENYPWNDSTWTFVEMKTKLVKEGEKPAIEDFAVETLYFDDSMGAWTIGNDITDMILLEPSYSFLMVAYSLEEMRLSHLHRFRKVQEFAADHGHAFYLLTSSSTEEVGEWEKRHDTGFQFCHADERVLKTMIRANPGLMLLKEGKVIEKWDAMSVPNIHQLMKELK